MNAAASQTHGAALLGVAAVALTAAAARVPGMSVRWLVAVVVAGALVLGMVVAVRRRRTGRALGRRVRVQLVPADGSNPSAEAVLRFAAGLARTRRVTGDLLASRASAVRIRLGGDALGRLSYELELPRHARPALDAVSYPEVDLVDHEPSTATDSTAMAMELVRVELVLARPSTAPLRDLGLEPDPLAGFARAVGTVDPATGESLEVCVDLLPVTPAGRRRLRGRLLRQARQTISRPGLGLWEMERGRRSSSPAELVERRAEQRALVAKLGSPEPLFVVQVLIAARAGTRGGAVRAAQAAVAALDAFAGENHFRVSGLRLPGGLAFIGGAESRWRRRRFDRRLATGLFAPSRRRVVTASEIAGLLKPPSVHCAAANVVRSGGVIPPAPPGLPTFRGEADRLPLGRLGPAGRVVAVPLKDTFFSYMGGRSRYGKTETAVGQCLHLARSGHGVFFLDPHQDAIAKLKTYLTDPELASRVVEVNLADPHRQPGWNLLAAQGLRPDQRANRIDAVVDAFASTLGWGEQNTRALNLITQATQALIELAAQLPRELAPTLFQIPTLLGNDAWRGMVLPFTAPATRRFFVERFPRLSSEAITPVTNLIDRLRVAPQVAALLGRPVSSYDVRAAMDQGRIVLASPGTGSVRDRLIANFLVYDLLHQAKTRTDTPPNRRRPFFVFLDEVQTYDGSSSENLAGLLEQAAKYGIRAFLFNQNPERLSAATWNAISTNRSHLAASALAAKAAGLITREWAGQIDPTVLTRMERYRYLTSITLNQQITPPFLIHGMQVEDLFPDTARPDELPSLDATIDQTTGRQPVTDTLRQLEDHDQRIADALRTQTPAGPGGRARGHREVSGPGGRA